jgi:hypothetical protein
VTVSYGGSFEAEYALFDPGDIELSAMGPGTIREAGYRSTAGEARTRLVNLGFTRELAEEAAAAARPLITRTYARGAAVRRVVDKLDAGELFEGRTFDPVTGRYSGAWLDLPALADALAPDVDAAQSSTLMQAFHLASLLAGRPEDEPLALSTVELTALRRPGERTFKRVALKHPHVLVHALGMLKPQREREGAETGPGRSDVVAWLRERAQRTPGAAARFAAIEASMGAREPPTRGPLADPELWAIETKLSLGETEGIADLLDAIERRSGRLPGTTYLRARTALMAGTEDPRAIADRACSLSTSMSAFHELQLLAAQACAAAGDVRRAHAFARDLLENATACDALRMLAREVIDQTGRATTAPEGGIPFIPKPPRNPSGTDPDAPASERPAGSFGASGSRRPPRDARDVRDARYAGERLLSLAADMSLPLVHVELRGDRTWSIAPEGEVPTEAAERLSLPPGMQDEPPPHDEAPRSPDAARLVCTYLARELGRELRMRHNLELRTDIDGLEMAQRYLREALTGEHARTTEEQREVMRHGALLGELLARRFGARWIDLESPDPGHWAMLVPSRSRPDAVCRVWPFGRVLRFLAQRHKERDLVSYYLQLEAHAR